MKTGLHTGIVVGSKTRVRCIYCDVFIPKANKCIEQHTNGVKHKENIELTSENGISLINEVLHCKPCQVNLTEGESVSKHIDGDSHANWMAAIEDLVDGEFINIDDYLSCDRDDVTCEVCDITLSCTLESIQEHVNSFNHRAKTVDRLKPLNGIFRVDNDAEVWCKICDAYIDNTVQGVLDHIDDNESHMQWFTDIEDLIEDQDISIEEYLANEHELNAFCNKCNVHIPCTVNKIEEHVYSESHLNQFS
ncbi:uncharacterized protein LOC134654885 [Cydia amplana]|uniref:uncharacterized protein LOC134654885 n=1 Tax=Cydia amplana TaxID=1869771 RepID=UPI002FE6AD5A